MMYDPNAEAAAMEEQAMESYKDQYLAWHEAQLEEGYSEEESSWEAYADHQADRAEAFYDNLEWERGCR